MNVYVFDRIDELTSNYHSGGGLVAFAENREEVERLCEPRGIVITEEEWSECRWHLLAPGEGMPGLHVHPDAGCC